MNTRRCLKIASRINALLVRELDQGVDPARMVAEPLYARDVLLVCEGMPGGEAAALAAEFREALAEVMSSDEGAASGFNPSRFLNSLFGNSTDGPVKPPGARRWFGRRKAAPNGGNSAGDNAGGSADGT